MFTDWETWQSSVLGVVLPEPQFSCGTWWHGITEGDVPRSVVGSRLGQQREPEVVEGPSSSWVPST